MSTLMVRSVSGTPTVSNFANMDGTPIVVDSATGNAYTLVAGVVTLLGARQYDYAEGTWTPVITFETIGNLSVVYSAQVGFYTKIGRLVTVNFAITTSTFTHTTASGALEITGLPYTSLTAAGIAHIGALQWRGITIANYTDMATRVASNSTLIRIAASGSGQAQTDISATDMPTGGTVILRSTITYIGA